MYKLKNLIIFIIIIGFVMPLCPSWSKGKDLRSFGVSPHGFESHRWQQKQSL